MAPTGWDPAAPTLIAIEGVDGSGKTTLCRELRKRLGNQAGSRIHRVADHMHTIFRELYERSDDESIMFRDFVPPDVRHIAYIVEALVQFRYCRKEYANSKFLIFDRWLATFDCFCGPISVHPEWYSELRSALPVPQHYFFLQADPELAIARLTERGDLWTRVYTSEELQRRIERLVDKYEKIAPAEGAIVLDASRKPEELADLVLERVYASSASTNGLGA